MTFGLFIVVKLNDCCHTQTNNPGKIFYGGYHAIIAGICNLLKMLKYNLLFALVHAFVLTGMPHVFYRFKLVDQSCF
jgi:hypothetical protein